MKQLMQMVTMVPGQGGLFNLYAENIMQNARLDDSPAIIKIAGRNINNLGYTADATLMAGSKEPLYEGERGE